MNPDQFQHMITWLNQQIIRLNESINEARQTNNYGRETQYEGMRDAFIKFLNKLKNTDEQKPKLKIINKRSNNN